jgi:protein-disulfide isomerase/uncharacterized membrane protein
VKAKSSSIRILLAVIGILLCLLGIYNEASIIINPDHKSSLCSFNETFDCSKAALSPYAKFLGIPTAGWGASFYLAMIVLEGAPAILFLLSLISVIASLYLFYISATVLHAVCPVCFSQYIVNLLIFAVAFSGAKKLSNLKSEIVELFSARIVRTVIVVIGSLSLLTSFYTYIQSARQTSTQQTGMQSFIAEWKSAPFYDFNIAQSGVLKDSIKGASDAKVTVVEFLDFECPACRAVAAEFRPLFEPQKEHARLVYKNYPLDKACNPSITQEMHINACFTAEIARCAGEQGKYWEAAEMLLEIPLEGKGPLFQADILTKVKRLISLDGDAMSDCLRSHRQMEAIKADMKLAESVAIQGTPTFYVNGRKTPSNSPSIVNAIIEEALKSTNP